MSNLILFFVICFNFLSVLSGLSQGNATPATTYLTDAIDEDDTTIPVASTVGFPYSDYIWLNNERDAYTSTDATHFLNVTRGAPDQNDQGGTASAQGVGTQVYTEGLNALNAMLGFNYTSLQLTYGTPIAFILSAFAYIGSIPRFVFWNIGFMQGSGWSLVKVIILYPLSAAFVIAFMFFLFQIIWMLKPAVI